MAGHIFNKTFYIILTDTKGAADAYVWEVGLNQRQRHGKRGKAKIDVADLERELRVKQEMLETMQGSFAPLRKYTVNNQLLCDSDLEEYDDLILTDDEVTEEAIEMDEAAMDGTTANILGSVTLIKNQPDARNAFQLSPSPGHENIAENTYVCPRTVTADRPQTSSSNNSVTSRTICSELMLENSFQKKVHVPANQGETTDLNTSNKISEFVNPVTLNFDGINAMHHTLLSAEINRNIKSDDVFQDAITGTMNTTFPASLKSLAISDSDMDGAGPTGNDSSPSHNDSSKVVSVYANAISGSESLSPMLNRDISDKGEIPQRPTGAVPKRSKCVTSGGVNTTQSPKELPISNFFLPRIKEFHPNKSYELFRESRQYENTRDSLAAELFKCMEMMSGGVFKQKMPVIYRYDFS